MKIARFLYKNNIGYGAVEKDAIHPISSSVFEDNLNLSDNELIFKDIKILSPVVPTKVVCIGLNYKDHAKELGLAVSKEPTIFLKPPTSIIGPGDRIVYPPMVQRLDYEAELAVVIKKTARNVKEEDASGYILGYTCLNDVTARDLQQKDIQWTRSKSFDTFCPAGPYIITEIKPNNLKIELLVNKIVRQSSSTSNLIFRIPFLISFISSVMTLLPGDIIATGTPAGIGPLSRGDEVEVKIEQLGSLINYVF